MKWKNLLKNVRVITLLIFLVLSLITIFSLSPNNWVGDGVAIRAVNFNSSAANAGIENPATNLQPLDREVIHQINGEKIHSIEEYYTTVESLPKDVTIRLETDQAEYTIATDQTNDQGVIDLGIVVEDVPHTNLRKGLDLAGGTRVLLAPEQKVSAEDLDLIVINLQQRLNVYGLSDVVITTAKDLGGNDFILVEIAGATENEVRDLLAQQGKFEAKIGDEVVFSGGNKDVTYVCRTADCSGINPQFGCYPLGSGTYGCSFFFGITLSPEAAQRQADITNELSIEREGTSTYLSEELVLFLDDAEVDRLRIAADLKGRAVTEIQITGNGEGISQDEAIDNALQNMKQLQTVLVTGSLPVSLEIVKMDSVSPSLGDEFLSNMFLVGLLAMVAIVSIIYFKYRKIKIAGLMLFIIVSEMILILGFAALFKWQMDLAAIAGIIIVAGTGVDHLIVITDETLRGEKIHSMKQRIKNAMFIVFGAYLTTVAGMLPLLWAGAGLLKGFALTTIAGISFGVLIARPAFAAIIEQILDSDDQAEEND